MVPAPGRVFGEIAFAHPALAGVAMTGSTATALTINRALAARGGAIVPLIAETGGLNAMLVDSTALPEQVVDDVVSSAFMSAGQRCSALRLLFLQEEIADHGVGDDRRRHGRTHHRRSAPVRDRRGAGHHAGGGGRARISMSSACARRRASSRRADWMKSHAHGSFFAPHLIELKNAAQLTREEFGPILHVVRYRSTDIRQGAAVHPRQPLWT